MQSGQTIELSADQVKGVVPHGAKVILGIQALTSSCSHASMTFFTGLA
jgi:hypothetical protein